MQKVLDHLIHESQTGFMKNRNISYNIRKTIDIMQFADEEDLQAVIISLDFEKAFYRVEMCALRGTLIYHNFGQNFIRWTMLLYEQFQSCTTNFGYNSQWFFPTRGLHQGCGTSCFYFILIVEVLGTQIQNNDNKKGIPL